MASPPTPELQPFIAAIGRRLSAAGIPFMLIGGQAVLVHGRPRLTEDIDITLGLAPAGWQTIRAVCADLDLEPSLRPARPPPANRAPRRFHLLDDAVRAASDRPRRACGRGRRTGAVRERRRPDHSQAVRRSATRPRRRGRRGAPRWRSPRLALHRPVGRRVRATPRTRRHEAAAQRRTTRSGPRVRATRPLGA